jgi:hypothetical protein
MNEKEIDYKNLIQSELFKRDFISLTNQLKRVNLDELLNSENRELDDINLLSFFISNCYFSL